MIKLSSVSLKASFNKGRKFSEISIFKLNRNVNLEDFLNFDRASYEVYPECEVDVPVEIMTDPNTPWGMPLGVNYESVNAKNKIYIASTLAIHLQNVELACKEKLLIFDHNFIIEEYLGSEYHAMGMRWLSKQWGSGRISLQREKTIGDEFVNYEIGIDFSTETGDTNVYHWIARTLPKIKFVKKLPSDIPIIFSYEPNIFQIDCLKFFGVNNPVIVINPNKVAKFKSLILIEGPWAVGNPHQENWIIQETLKNISHESLDENNPPPQKKKIFIYRDKFARRLMINQMDVLNILVERGYEAYNIENYNYEDCVRLFNSAEEIVFEHGASGIWILFTSPNARILELLPEKNHISSKQTSNYYFWLSCFLKRKFLYLICKNKSLKPWAEYEVNLNELVLQLDKLAL